MRIEALPQRSDELRHESGGHRLIMEDGQSGVERRPVRDAPGDGWFSCRRLGSQLNCATAKDECEEHRGKNAKTPAKQCFGGYLVTDEQRC